ncbi:MAG: 50S ribosomal protein L21 [Oscillospiraceae bacterium]
MYAVIVTGGKQYRVSEGDIIYVEKLVANDGETVTFDNVLAIGGEKTAKIGTPTVKGATVTGTVLKHGKAKKVVVFKYRSKKDSKSKMGHRQLFTKVEITAVNG